MAKSLTIITRKPRDNDGNEFVVVDRGPGGSSMVPRYVSATANAFSLANGEWFWGHYFFTQEDAMQHFNSRGPIA